jgi:hypothetical protein
MKKYWKIILLIILIGGLVLSIKYVFDSEKINLNSYKPDYTLSCEVLLSDFENNEKDANQKYLNKVVQVSGNIGEIVQSPENKCIVVLKSKTDIFGINCMITDRNFNSKDYRVGDMVTIKGIVNGFLDDVILSDCILIK